ncbi:MAG: dephospho-CoA kinase [Candidatus Omnitrophota bacterium]|jgi:dephospho-CoA kinase|nr:MAG: dephospho-CoA kinase [Candidatus Omnitrophota bacterium]
MKREPTRIVIGITGSFGSGKTTVAGFFKSWGAAVIDADKIGREFLVPGSAAYRRVVSVFGDSILLPDKDIDRNKLASLVFKKHRLRNELNRITHPLIIRRIKKEIKESPRKTIILDAPLLLEAGLRPIVDKLIVVTARRDIQIRRIQKRSALAEEAILRRIRSQIPLHKKRKMADFIIDNNGTLKNTKKQAELIRRLWWKS